ncbi:hypothetical protein RND81_01G009800 [Saponaria officinalis]|uniref:Uncharacterized protein n=1 Tax=Saponaria officinalis TaxID=3572 RepID=A0AAW1N811_SAPOF
MFSIHTLKKLRAVEDKIWSITFPNTSPPTQPSSNKILSSTPHFRQFSMASEGEKSTPPPAPKSIKIKRVRDESSSISSSTPPPASKSRKINDPSLHMTVVNPPSPMSVSVGSRKRSYDAISSGSQVDVESLTDRVACQLVRLEECGAIDCDMLDKACMAYNRFLREDLTLHVKVFLHAKTVANKLKRLERDLKMYDQMI